MLRAFVKSFAPRTGLLTLAGLLSLSVVPAISHAAIAHIDYIVATRKQNNPPFGIFYNEIEWRIDLTWTGTPRRGAEHLWWDPDVGASVTIQSTLHYVSLGDNVVRIRNDEPRNAGKYYLNVNVYNPDTGEVFASDTDFDTMP